MFGKAPQYRALLGATARLGRQAAVVLEVAGRGGEQGVGDDHREEGGESSEAFLR
jgi:hypothetical protein